MEKYLHKGARIALVGTLDQNRWVSNEGDQKSNFQILVNTIEFIKINSHDPEQGQTLYDDVSF